MRLALPHGNFLDFDDHPLLMAILNVTPDSFSDGGQAVTPQDALEKGRRLVADGADLLDIGGESTRPGFTPVSAEEEIRRTAPAIRLLREAFPGLPISIDTSKPEVAKAAFDAGADLLNDVTAMEQGGEEMARAVRDSGAACILMHAVPSPEGKAFPEALLAYFRERIAWCVSQGIGEERVAIDPGIGFAKNLAQNLSCLTSLPLLRTLGRPVLIGHSRKSFLGLLTSRPVHERLAASTATAALAAYLGADLLRVHDVAATRDAISVAAALKPSPTPAPHTER